MGKPAVSRSKFAGYVADAYEHLHDLVYLRKHPLGEIIFPSTALADKARARELHNLLYDLIEELDPGPAAAVFSPEWRRYRFLELRYLKGLSHEEIAEQFGVGLRQYYRLRRTILREVTGILWDRCAALPPEAQAPPRLEAEPEASRLELLRLEGARLIQADRYAHLPEVVEGVFATLRGLLQQRDVAVAVTFPEALPAASVAQDLLRHILLEVLAALIGRAQHAAIRVTARAEGATVSLAVQIEPPEVVDAAGPGQSDGWLAELQEMARLSECHILPITAGASIAGYEVRMPVARRTVLVIDDNEDAVHLFQRYLSLRGYSVVAATTAQDALEKARQYQPYAITLDLMMPGHDGWELLQILVNDPETGHIPVIVCTVLKQKDLALSLGAAEYLVKPVTEQTLLSALEALSEA